ncbi:glycyl-radical enzyme activating protein [bacterium]|nr:glycyl-radical enzyme activating protein [bacterium]
MNNIDQKSNPNFGTLLEIQRMSTEDGPGLRTSVFLKGCTLKCEWCHNPESIALKPQLHWINSRCIGCKICIDTCMHNALKDNESGIIIDRNACTGCGECAKECPTTAMEIMGVKWSVDELINELLKDRSYFENSDQGGVTISGGELTMQSSFAEQVLAGLQKENIHTTIDTCGQCKWESFANLLPFTDHILFDLKEIDTDLHKQFTGSANFVILQNIKKLGRYLLQNPKKTKLWIRTPIIPLATSNRETVERIGKFINQNLLDVVQRWDLCSFNNLCQDKYKRLGIDWKYCETELLTKTEMESLTQIAKDILNNSSIVQWSGATKIEDSDKPKQKHTVENV